MVDRRGDLEVEPVQHVLIPRRHDGEDPPAAGPALLQPAPGRLARGKQRVIEIAGDSDLANALDDRSDAAL